MRCSAPLFPGKLLRFVNVILCVFVCVCVCNDTCIHTCTEEERERARERERRREREMLGLPPPQELAAIFNKFDPA